MFVNLHGRTGRFLSAVILIVVARGCITFAATGSPNGQHSPRPIPSGMVEDSTGACSYEGQIVTVNGVQYVCHSR